MRVRGVDDEGAGHEGVRARADVWRAEVLEYSEVPECGLCR